MRRERFFINNRQSGFSLAEAVLASALLALLLTGLIGGLIYGRDSARLAGEREQAVLLAEEGIEAVRNIRDGGFANLTNGTFGLASASPYWVLAGSQDTTGIFTRQITIASVDANTKSVTAAVSWAQNLQRPGSVIEVAHYLNNWSGQTVASCSDLCIFQGYGSGRCRNNQCNAQETNLPEGDAFCLVQNVCCCR